MSEYTKSLSQLESELKTSLTGGLTAKQAEELLLSVGENKLKAKKKKTMLAKFLEQFKDVMILILIIAAAVSFALAIYEGHAREFIEPSLILLIVILNAILGVVQESKAEKALEALQKLSAPNAKIIRDGAQSVIDAANLVPGDIILLEAGDFIPADARLIESASLKCEESALTGESVPSEKDSNTAVKEKAPIGDRSNMVYSGCSVTYGRAKAVITATGMQTEMGKIAGMLDNETDMQTPLQQRLAQMGKYLGIIALAACAIVFVIGIIDNIPVMDMFMIAVSLAVSAIPEGLPAIVTIVLSIGVQRMVKANAIIRRLPAVETLGSASVICSDKTGTLTQNRMTLVKAYAESGSVSEDISSENGTEIRELLKISALCCDGDVVIEDGSERHIGDPTETAIVLAAIKNGLTKEKLAAEYPRTAEIPFDSDRKLMTVVVKREERYLVIVKGAFDMLAPLCVSGDIEKARKITDAMSADALRVIAVAYKEIDSSPQKATSEELECGLNFAGLVGMIDPPREEARDAVATCRKAGIRPVMITGDHIITACAIAKDLGILKDRDEAITGAQLAAMNEEELAARVRNISVYARVSPEDKIRIVKAWQAQGEIVSMTGDGVNDAPALKAADIGCAMGITGTDVAKGAADMTLTDDNFATIVRAVKEGRGIYDNIKKAVGFLLSSNVGELFAVFLSMLFWRNSPLLSMQLLWINLATDSLPAVALGMEAVEDDIMDHTPKPKSESIFAHGLGIKIALYGLLFAGLTMLGFYIGGGTSGNLDGGRTMAFLVLAILQIFHAFNMRSPHSVFRIGLFSNRMMNLAAASSLGLIALVTLVKPIASAFGMILLEPVKYLIAFGLAAVPLVITEIVKLFTDKKSK